MSLKQKINEDIKKAMIDKKQEELIALRSIKSAILVAETEKGASGELNQDAELKLLMKAAKQRKESAEVFENQGRQDLMDKELKELSVIEKYLPKQMSKEELQSELEEIIKEVGASGPKDMGKVMGVASKKFSGKADGKLISEIVREILNS